MQINTSDPAPGVVFISKGGIMRYEELTPSEVMPQRDVISGVDPDWFAPETDPQCVRALSHEATLTILRQHDPIERCDKNFNEALFTD